MVYPLPRTDLAVEAHRVRAGAGRLEGVEVRETDRSGFRVTTVEVRSPAASEELCKPIGIYHTVTLDPMLRREEASFSSAAELISGLIINRTVRIFQSLTGILLRAA